MTGFLRSAALLAALAWPAQAAEPVVAPAPAQFTADVPVALLVDLQSGQELYAKAPDRRFVPASITKIMTVYVAFELIDSGQLKPWQKFTFRPEAAAEWRRKGSTMFLEPGESVSVDELLHGITSVSANDGAITLAEGVAGSVPAWAARMNAAARTLGMSNSHFATPNGWPDGGRTFTTARDLARLAQALISRHPVLYARYFGKPGMAHNGFVQANHDPISGVVKGADGIKTGYTAQAGYGFVGSAVRDGTRLVMVVGGAVRAPMRDAAARQLIEWGFAAFDQRRLFARNAQVGTALVQGGARRTVRLVAPQDVIAAVPAGSRAGIKLSLAYEGPLPAPIRAGTPVARLLIAVDGMPQASVPLAAAEDVPEAGFFGRIANAFATWWR